MFLNLKIKEREAKSKEEQLLRVVPTLERKYSRHTCKAKGQDIAYRVYESTFKS